MFLGIYHHDVPSDLQAVGVHGHEVANTWTNQAIAFASSYAAKTALLLRLLPPP